MDYIQTKILDVDDLLRLPRLLPGFIFRGQADSRWGLKTSIERMMESRGGISCSLKKLELRMVNEYKKRRHLYTGDSIDENDIFEWMAELQHYGAPTRLLDFTFSPYVAAYFATHRARGECSVWGINNSIINYFLKEKFDPGFEFMQPFDWRGLLNGEMNSVKINLSQNYVVTLRPSRENIRIYRQQGLFISQVSTVNLEKPDDYLFFENCLATTLGEQEIPALGEKSFSEFEDLLKDRRLNDRGLTAPKIVKLDIPYDLMEEVKRSLNFMSINAESLFPGLDGLAQSIFNNN